MKCKVIKCNGEDFKEGYCFEHYEALKKVIECNKRHEKKIKKEMRTQW